MPLPVRPPEDNGGTGDGDGVSKQVADLEKRLAVRDAEYASVNQNLQAVTTERNSLSTRVNDLQAAITERERQLGELRTKADDADRLRTERDDLLGQLSQERAQADRRTADAVQQALGQSETQHKAETDRLSQEKAALQAEVDTLKRQIEGQGVTGRVTPSTLAGQFAAVLDRHGAPPPEPGKPFAAALTGLEVQARGMLEAPKEGETEPVLRTVEGGTIHPDELSTVTMRFSLLPHAVPASETPPPGPDT